jgi:hypothetical protein
LSPYCTSGVFSYSAATSTTVGDICQDGPDAVRPSRPLKLNGATRSYGGRDIRVDGIFVAYNVLAPASGMSCIALNGDLETLALTGTQSGGRIQDLEPLHTSQESEGTRLC